MWAAGQGDRPPSSSPWDWILRHRRSLEAGPSPEPGRWPRSTGGPGREPLGPARSHPTELGVSSCLRGCGQVRKSVDLGARSAVLLE